MRPILMTFTIVSVFAFGMSASMAQSHLAQIRQDPGTIKVTPPVQTSPAPIQTQPTPTPNLNTSKNPYEQKRYMETPVQQKK